jgi:hypothetical protein
MLEKRLQTSDRKSAVEIARSNADSDRAQSLKLNTEIEDFSRWKKLRLRRVAPAITNSSVTVSIEDFGGKWGDGHSFHTVSDSVFGS